MNRINSKALKLAFASALATAACSGGTPAEATVSLPSIISNHMMVQANANPHIWGWAAPNEQVEIKYLSKSISVTASADGKWEATLGKIKPGTQFDIEIAGKENKISVVDALAGEVWVCSGQSNMEFPLGRASQSTTEFENHSWPRIRFFKVKNEHSASPLVNVTGSWEVFSPDAAKKWSAVGYFFAKRLHEDLNEPVGMIQAAVGGTSIQVWISQEGLKSVSLGRMWSSDQNSGHPYMPSCLFNGMIYGLTHYTISGATWYQGESNAKEPEIYKVQFPALINDWRKSWGDPKLPFIYVQLPSYGRKIPPNQQSKWAEIREAQSLALSLPNTAMAVTIDVGDSANLHPPNKKPVGERLADCAEATVYKRRVAYQGPTIKSVHVQNSGLLCRFDHADKGLRIKNGAALNDFQIAGADKKYVPADAKIDGKNVFLSSSLVQVPVYARYAWDDAPEASLENGFGLPAAPFQISTTPSNAASSEPQIIRR
ncbi:MAG TPA: sialate O-acetylesterase [Oculatellaceae cyanobacterium]